jgi:hypothetical protein
MNTECAQFVNGTKKGALRQHNTLQLRSRRHEMQHAATKKEDKLAGQGSVIKEAEKLVKQA